MRRLLPVCALVLASSASAQPDDPLEVADGDPMTLARAVARSGDDPVLERLGDESADNRLIAIEASPFLAEPELALPGLVLLARGRDPWLAPAAARALVSIADALSFDDLERREADLETLDAATTALAELAEDETARADIRAAAGLASGQLRSGAVPARASG